MCNLIFENINSKEDFLSLLKQEEIKNIILNSFLLPEIYKKSTKAIENLSIKEEYLFIKILQYLDKKFSKKSKKTKILTMLTSSIYIQKDYNKIKDYNLLHLISICEFSIYDQLENYAINIEILSKELFAIYKRKTNHYDFYIDFNELAIVLFEKGYDINDIKSFFINHSCCELLQMEGEYMNNFIEKSGILF